MKYAKKITLLIAIVLVSAALSLGYDFYSKKTPLLTVQHSYQREILNIPVGNEILAGNDIRGNFKAQDNYLGIVEIRFIVPEKPSKDLFIFRLKEKDAGGWYYENTYRAKEFGGYPLFPFGFPVIKESKGREYYFELISLQGESGNAVGISYVEPVVVARHTLSRAYFLEHKEELIGFLFNKIKGTLLEPNTLANFVILFLVLSIPLFIKATLPKVNVEFFTTKLENRLRRQEHILPKVILQVQIVVLRIFKILEYIILFVFKILYSFHSWLGKK